LIAGGGSDQGITLEVLGSQLHSLEETIRRLRQLMQKLPRSDLRNRLLDEVSALDSIADSIRQAPDLQPKSTKEGPEQ
jgi:hypothetical protein